MKIIPIFSKRQFCIFFSSWIFIIFLCNLPVNITCFPSQNRLDNAEISPSAANNSPKHASPLWFSQNLINDSGFTAGGFPYSAWTPLVQQIGPDGTIEPTEDKVEYILTDTGYIHLQIHGDAEDTVVGDDIGESVAISQTLPYNLYFANPDNITFYLKLTYHFQVSAGSGSQKRMTRAFFQAGINGVFENLVEYDNNKKSQTAFDEGIKSVTIPFDMENYAIGNQFRTNFTVEIRLTSEAIAFSQYITVDIDNVFVFCDASATPNPAIELKDNKIKQTSIITDGKFNLGYWQQTAGWTANVFEINGSNKGIEASRFSDFVYYAKDTTYKADGSIDKNISDTTLQLHDDNSTGADTNEVAQISQLLPSLYLVNPSNLTIEVHFSYSFMLSAKDSAEINNISVCVGLSDQTQEIISHFSTTTSSYDSGNQKASAIFDMSEVAPAYRYNTGFLLTISMSGCTGGNQYAILTISSVDVFCTYSLSQAPVVTHPIDKNITKGTNDQITWTPSDPITHIRTYTVYRDGMVELQGTWVSGQSINVPIRSSIVGSNSYVLILDDGLGGIVTDTILITIIAGSQPDSNPENGGTQENDDKEISNTESENTTHEDSATDSNNSNEEPKNPSPMLWIIGVLGLSAGVMVIKRIQRVPRDNVRKLRISYQQVVNRLQRLNSSSTIENTKETNGHLSSEEYDEKIPVVNPQIASSSAPEIDQILAAAKAAFAEGGYLEAIAQYEKLIEKISGSKKDVDLLLEILEIVFTLKQNAAERDAIMDKLDIALAAKERDIVLIMNLYAELMQVCKVLNDLNSIEEYQDQQLELLPELNKSMLF